MTAPSFLKRCNACGAAVSWAAVLPSNKLTLIDAESRHDGRWRIVHVTTELFVNERGQVIKPRTAVVERASNFDGTAHFVMHTLTCSALARDRKQAA